MQFQMHLAKPVKSDVLLEAVVELSKRSASDHALGEGFSRASAERKDLDESDAFYASPKLAA